MSGPEALPINPTTSPSAFMAAGVNAVSPAGIGIAV